MHKEWLVKHGDESHRRQYVKLQVWTMRAEIAHSCGVLASYIVREYTEGKTAYAIARDLNRDAAPTAQGCARLVASYGPRAADAGRRLSTAFIDYGHRGLRRPNLNGRHGQRILGGFTH
jgi:hypothetical protein